MEDAFRKGLTMVQPDEVCYRYVLQTAAHKPTLMDLGPVVDEALSRMQDNFMVPDSLCYGAAIRTWKNAAVYQSSKVPASILEASVHRAVELLSEMEVAHNRSSVADVKITTANVNDCLEALAVSTHRGRTEQAEFLLAKMEDEIEAGNHSMFPNAESYIHVLRVWKSVVSIEKVANAKLIIWRMKDRYEVLSKQHKKKTRLVDVFNEFLNVCGSHKARSEKEGIEVFGEALDAIDIIRSLPELEPNSATYVALLNACANLLPIGKERSRLVKKVFSLCCQDGMVDEAVLNQLKAASLEQEYARMVMDECKTMGTIKIVPESWSVRALGGRIISADGRKTRPLSAEGKLTTTVAMQEFKMRKLRDGRNRKLLQGGRLNAQRDFKPPEPWRLYDSET
jgi:hypothetical protein